MDGNISERKKKNNLKLKDRYHNDIKYREKKKRIAIEYYYNKKNATGQLSIQKNNQPVFLYFDQVENELYCWNRYHKRGGSG